MPSEFVVALFHSFLGLLIAWSLTTEQRKRKDAVMYGWDCLIIFTYIFYFEIYQSQSTAKNVYSPLSLSMAYYTSYILTTCIYIVTELFLNLHIDIYRDSQLQYNWWFGLNNSLSLGAVLCFSGYLVASLAVLTRV